MPAVEFATLWSVGHNDFVLLFIVERRTDSAGIIWVLVSNDFGDHWA